MVDITSLPNLPGVYIFKNKLHEIIYIGKARFLKKRVASYFNKQVLDWKLQGIRNECLYVEYKVTNNEIEALLLEAALVQQHKPRFNVLLKYGTPFLYIYFQKKGSVGIHVATKQPQRGLWVGPLLRAGIVKKIVHFLEQTFQLYHCNKKISQGCLYYHLGTCGGFCRDDFDLDGYLNRLNLAYLALTKQQTEFIEMIYQQIALYNEKRAFEKSAQWFEYVRRVNDIFVFFSYPDEHDDTYGEYVTTNVKLSLDLQKFLGTDRPIITIDSFDISHFQGKYIVGSSVRFTHGVPDKMQFRHFNIKSLDNQNDYAALQEIVLRRYAQDSLPDLILIDGGKGQRNAIVEVLPSVYSSHIVSLAKREERLFAHQHPEGIVLDKHALIGLFLIKMRDYAHKYAIAFHKKKRMAILNVKK